MTGGHDTHTRHTNCLVERSVVAEYRLRGCLCVSVCVCLCVFVSVCVFVLVYVCLTVSVRY